MLKKRKIQGIYDKLLNSDRLAILDGNITTRFGHIELNGVKKIIMAKENFAVNKQHVLIFDLEKLRKVGIHVYLTSQEIYWIYWHHVRIGKEACPPTPITIRNYLKKALKEGIIADLPTNEYKKTRRKLKKLGDI